MSQGGSEDRETSALDALSPAKRALLQRALERRRQAAAAGATGPPALSISRRPDSGPAPLSHSQQRMWFLQQWEPDAPTFNGARALRLRGRLDRDALTAGLREIVKRHEALRTVVLPGPEPRQQALESWALAVPVLTLPGAQDAQAELPALLRELSRQPFDLEHDLMLRASLIELGPEEHVLLIRMHHIAADAHSDSVLFRELSELYNARRQNRHPDLPELPIQYADFAVWQRQRLQGKHLQDLVAYWTRHLEGAPPLLNLPTDRPRPAVQRHEGVHHRFSFPRELARPLEAFGREQGVTFYMTMLAVFSTLLYRISGETDIVIGSPIANRNLLELQGLIGFFTNTITLRTRLSGNPSFREVVSRARDAALGAYAHQDMPFEKVVEALAPPRDPSYNPLFQVNFRAQASARPALALDGIETEPIPVDIGFSRFDLALELELRETALSGYFEYNRDLFLPATAGALVEDLEALLRGVGEDPDLPVLEVRLPHGRRVGGARSSGRAIARRQTR